MEFKNSILETKTLNSTFPYEKVIHIALAIDEPFVPPAGILITSILKNNPARNFFVHIFLDKISQSSIERLQKFCKLSNKIQIKIYYVNPTLFKNLYFDKNYSVAIFYRIVAADILADELDEMIYMDSDMLCLKSMEELFQNSSKEYLLKAVADSGRWLAEHKRNLNLSADFRYFNAGILYLNLKKWRQEKISAQLIELLRNSDYNLPDQDTLNMIAYRNNYAIEYLPKKFNHFFRLDGTEIPITDDVVIEHFAGNLKPWYLWCDSEVKQLYESYQAESFWSDFKYLPKNYQECRFMGNVFRRNGNWLEAFKWYVKYVENKFKKFF